MGDYRTQDEVGLRIRELRKGAGMSQGQLADAVGLDQPAVARIERGERALSARVLVLAAERFAVSEASILKHEESLALLRAGDADSEGVAKSIDEFRSCIEDFFGVHALVA